MEVVGGQNNFQRLQGGKFIEACVWIGGSAHTAVLYDGPMPQV
jgi:hypothetical protein